MIETANKEGTESDFDTRVLKQLRDEDCLVDSLNLVTTTGGERTYLATADVPSCRAQRYVKTLQTSDVTLIERALNTTADLGIPETEIVGNNPPLLVMEPASGKPLSRLLPGYMLPGVWWHQRSDLVAGFRNLGKYLGRIHSQTTDDTRPLNQFDWFVRQLSLDDSLDDVLSDSLGERVRRSFEAVRDAETVDAAIHDDPTPHNLYYANGDIELIDFAFQSGPAVKDVIVVEQAIRLSVGRLPYGRSGQAMALLDAFKSGYRATGPPLELSGETYGTLMIAAHTTLLASYVAGRVTLRSRITRRFDVPLLERCIEIELRTENRRPKTGRQ